MVATAEEDSRLFLHHQQREPEYARGKPYQPYPVVVLTLVHNLPMFLSQLMINLWNTEGIRFCFFLWNSANDHECQSKCLRICNQYCCLSETWFKQPDPSFFYEAWYSRYVYLKRRFRQEFREKQPIFREFFVVVEVTPIFHSAIDHQTTCSLCCQMSDTLKV